MRAVCKTTCSCYLHRGREEAGDCEMANHRAKGVKRGCLVLGVGCRRTRSLLTRPYGESSRNRPYRGQAFRGRDKRGAGRKEARSARTRVANGPWSTEPQKKRRENELWVAEEWGGKENLENVRTRNYQVQRECGRTRRTSGTGGARLAITWFRGPPGRTLQ